MREDKQIYAKYENPVQGIRNPISRCRLYQSQTFLTTKIKLNYQLLHQYTFNYHFYMGYFYCADYVIVAQF